MKIIKIKEFHGNQKNPRENRKTNEDHRIPRDNLRNHETLICPYDN